MSFSGKPGDTLFLPDSGDGHWYILLTKPNSNGKVVTVNFTTASHFPQLVVLRPKDNRKLFKKKCTPNYIDASFRSASKLTAYANRYPNKYCYCDEVVRMKIVIGAIQSQDIDQDLLKELEIQYPSEYLKNIPQIDPQNT